MRCGNLQSKEVQRNQTYTEIKHKWKFDPSSKLSKTHGVSQISVNNSCLHWNAPKGQHLDVKGFFHSLLLLVIRPVLENSWFVSTLLVHDYVALSVNNMEDCQSKKWELACPWILWGDSLAVLQFYSQKKIPWHPWCSTNCCLIKSGEVCYVPFLFGACLRACWRPHGYDATRFDVSSGDETRYLLRSAVAGKELNLCFCEFVTHWFFPAVIQSALRSQFNLLCDSCLYCDCCAALHPSCLLNSDACWEMMGIQTHPWFKEMSVREKLNFTTLWTSETIMRKVQAMQYVAYPFFMTWCRKSETSFLYIYLDFLFSNIILGSRKRRKMGCGWF